MPDSPELKPARVFLALWPDVMARRRLAEEAKRLHALLGGRLTRADTIHLTLVFIGNLARERLPILTEAVAADAAPGAFDLTLDRAECWRRNRIACLGASRPPSQLGELVASLETALHGAGITYDARPFKAHVTLLRNAGCKENPVDDRAAFLNPDPAIVWPVREFVLVESVPAPEGARYRNLARHTLL